MPIGKSKRFQMFARDGFTCRYCGQRPPDVILELDHIHPRAEGGTDDELNLITSCFDCNRGKRDKIISEIAPRPDADVEYLKLQQEIAEVKRYQKAKAVRDKAFSSLTETLNHVWANNLTADSVPNERQWRVWLGRYSPEMLESAIHKTVPKYMAGGFNGRGEFQQLCRYVSGVLKSLTTEKDDEELVTEQQAIDWIINAEVPHIQRHETVIHSLVASAGPYSLPGWLKDSMVLLWRELQRELDEYKSYPEEWEERVRAEWAKKKAEGASGNN